MSELTDVLRQYIKEEMAWSGAPGVSMTIVHGDETEFIMEGFRDREAKLPVDTKTCFVIASCSKSMTTAMLGRLVDERILDWDEPVTTYCPDLQMMDPAAKNMTLRDMLLHRTGLANHDGLWPDVTGRDVLAKRLRYIEPNLNFRIRKRQYNNVIYALTAYVAECATGKTYDQLMKEYIFDPLGMTRTYTRYEDFCDCGNLAEPYYFSKETNTLVMQDKWNMNSAVAAASIATDAEDVEKWLRFNMNEGVTADGIRLMTQETWNTIHHGSIAAAEDKRRDCLVFNSYGFGWWEGKFRGHAIYKHTGKINGYSSLEIFIPDLKLACFTTINIHCPESHLYYPASYIAFDRLMGIEEDPAEWRKAYRTEETDLLALLRGNDLDYMPEKKNPAAQAALPLENYAGEYFDNGYGPLKITVENGALVAYHRNYRNPLTHYDGEVFQALEFWEDVLNITMPFDFKTNIGETTPYEVVLPMEPTVKPIHFKRIR